MTDNMKRLAAEIASASNIEALCQRLNAAEDSLRDTETRLEEVVDLAGLPAWGEGRRDTRDVWSWDTTRYLRHSVERRWYLQTRQSTQEAQ